MVHGVDLCVDVTEGISDYSSRSTLKQLFQQFGEVTACWIPPLDHRGKEPAFVKFGKASPAQTALMACQSGQLFMDGLRVNAQWRTTPKPTQDSNRDFDAKGSNLFTSREFREQAVRDLNRDRDRRRGHSRSSNKSRSKSRDRRKSSRSKTRSRKRSGSRNKSKSRKRSKSRNKS